MNIEYELDTLKAKILRGKHISETFKRELSNDIIDIKQKLVKESDSLPCVGDYFSFAKHLGKHFQYSDNTKDGDRYTDRDGTTYTEEEIYDEWMNER